MHNMKLYIVGIGLAVMSLTGCTAGFLDVESKRESTTGNFYRTESDAWRALIGCYDGWESGMCFLFCFANHGGRVLCRYGKY